MNLAPIVLFVYNRPTHAKYTLDALKNNHLAKDSELVIFSDGFKSELDAPRVRELRQYLKTIDGFKKISIIERPTNFGLARNVIDGVTSIVKQCGRVIVLEDDLVTAPNFLNFMNESLEKYRDDKSVFSVTGYSFTDGLTDSSESYFLKLTSSWGWATWSDRWDYFNGHPSILQKILQNKKIRSDFNFNESFNFISMAKMQLEGKINSWAIYWYSNVFFQKGLTLYPSQKLLNNIGMDGSGVHGGSKEKCETLSAFNYVLPIKVEESIEWRIMVEKVLKSKKGYFLRNSRARFTKQLKNLFSERWLIKIFLLKNRFKLLFFSKRIGRNTFIDKSVSVYGWDKISIGSNTLVGQFSWLNVNERTNNLNQIEIGNSCYIGRNNFISCGKFLKLSDYVMTSNDCKFLGSNHVFSDASKPYIATGTTNNESMIIGVNVWFGVSTVVLGGVKVGHGSIIGACSLITKDIPPFSIVVGNPARVIKRYDFVSKRWVALEEFTMAMEKLLPSEEDYLARLRKDFPNIIMPVHGATSTLGDLL